MAVGWPQREKGRLIDVVRSAPGPQPRLFDALYGDLVLPPECGCALPAGNERATATLTDNEPPAYEAARLEFETLVGHPFRQVVVNAYTRPMNLYLHNDKPDLWGAVAIVSLGAPCTFVLVPAADAFYGDTDVSARPGWEIGLAHGDVVYLDEPTNRYWFHGGVMPAGRFSLVWREYVGRTAPSIDGNSLHVQM